MPHHKVAHRTETRGLMHRREVCVAELIDQRGRVVAVGVGADEATARDRLRINVADMHSDQLEALKEGL